MAWILLVSEVVQVNQVKDRAGAWIYGSRPGAPGAPKVLFYVFMVLLAYSVFSYFFLFFPISRLSQSEITKIRSNPVGSGQELLTSFFFLCVYVGVMTSPCYLIIKLIPISRLV